MPPTTLNGTDSCINPASMGRSAKADRKRTRISFASTPSDSSWLTLEATHDASSSSV